MLKRIPDKSGTAAARPLQFTFDGTVLSGREGDSLAAALLAAGILRFRESQVGGGPRGPFCMMGACFECLVEIDGQPNRQACMVPLSEGMTVRSQRAAVELAAGKEA